MNYETLIHNKPELFSNENALIQIITQEEKISKWVDEQKLALAHAGKPISWAEIGVVYEDPYIIILRDLVRLPSGNLGSFFRILNHADLKGGQTIVMLPIYEGKILALRQFRHPTRSWHWEVPRGFSEPGITAEENAKLELMQEIGGTIICTADLGPYHNNTGIEGTLINLLLVDLSAIGQSNADEGIKEYQLFEITEFERMIRDAEITDGFSIAAFTRAKLKNLLDFG